MKNYIDFEKDSEASKVLTDWHKQLEKNRGDRAALRRCASLTEVTFVPTYHRLYRELSKIGRVNVEALALVVVLSAHVKENAHKLSIAKQMAQGKAKGGSARVSGLRFRRLLKCEVRQALFPAMVRIIALLGASVNLASLAQSVYWWNDKTRKQWAFDYYSTAPSES